MMAVDCSGAMIMHRLILGETAARGCAYRTALNAVPTISMRRVRSIFALKAHAAMDVH